MEYRLAVVAMLGLITATTACGGTGSVASDASSAEDPVSPTATASGTVAVEDDEPWIVYQWVDASGDGIFLVRPDGTGHHQLVPDMTGSEIHPDWSPDGSRIAFVEQTIEGPTELWVINADGTDAERLHTCELPCNEIGSPDWSPDGASIYFSQSADVPPGEVIPRTFSIGRVDVAEGTVDVVLSRDDGVEVWQPRVSPDGSTIAYAAGSEQLGGTAILTSPVDGGTETRLTEWELFAANPDWTPDGRIVFNSNDLGFLDGGADLYLMEADGSGLTPLTDFAEEGIRASQPQVSPDGSGIAFTHEPPTGGSGSRRLAFLAFGDTQPRWLADDPISGTHPQLRPSPRGR